MDREIERIEGIEATGYDTTSSQADTAPQTAAAPADRSVSVAPLSQEATPFHQSQQYMEHTMNQAPKKRLSVGIIALSVITVALLAVTGWLIYDKKNTGDELASVKSQLSSRSSSAEGRGGSMQGESDIKPADAPNTKPAPVAQSNYRVIPEWGVRYKVEDGQKDNDITYTLFVRGEGDSLGVRSVATARGVKNPGVYPGEDYPCSNPEQALGHITRMTAETYNKNMQDFKAGNPFADVSKAVKVGDYYYLYQRAQAMSCTQTNPPSQKFKEHSDKWESYGKYVEDSVIKKLEVIK